MIKLEYDYYSTPGHGYLVVPMADIRELGFVSTEYSFHNNTQAWLEEDCDMSAFLWIYEKKYGSRPIIHDHYTEGEIKVGKSYFQVGDQPSTYDEVKEEWQTIHS